MNDEIAKLLVNALLIHNDIQLQIRDQLERIAIGLESQYHAQKEGVR